jgi:hypothetical protein
MTDLKKLVADIAEDIVENKYTHSVVDSDNSEILYCSLCDNNLKEGHDSDCLFKQAEKMINNLDFFNSNWKKFIESLEHDTIVEYRLKGSKIRHCAFCESTLNEEDHYSFCLQKDIDKAFSNL